MPLIRLTEWARREFDPPPAERTLHLWVANGRIVPAPVKIGRAYFVDPKAQHIAVAKQRLIDAVRGG